MIPLTVSPNPSSTNRTILELKLWLPNNTKNINNRTNRTILELKYLPGIDYQTNTCRTNRTILESKIGLA